MLFSFFFDRMSHSWIPGFYTEKKTNYKMTHFLSLSFKTEVEMTSFGQYESNGQKDAQLGPLTCSPAGCTDVMVQLMSFISYNTDSFTGDFVKHRQSSWPFMNMMVEKETYWSWNALTLCGVCVWTGGVIDSVTPDFQHFGCISADQWHFVQVTFEVLQGFFVEGWGYGLAFQAGLTLKTE